jgi:hypothetical protein
MYTDLCKWKNGICETVSGIRGGGCKTSERGEFKYVLFDTL